MRQSCRHRWPGADELNAARSAVRSPAPSMRRTSGEPTAAERRPERRTLLGIAAALALSYLVGELFGYLAQPRSSRRIHWCAVFLVGPAFVRINAAAPRSKRRKIGEPVGLTVSPPSATIMKVATRHEAESKMDEQVHCSWRRCRWPRSGPVPEVPSGSLRWAK